MKVLILGDFSGVNFFLWKGLKELGVDVVQYSRGDSFKKLPAQHLFYIRSEHENPFFGATREIINQLSTAVHLVGYDIVVLHSAYQFHNRINSWLLPWVLRRNAKVVLQNMACSHAYHAFTNKLAYSPCNDCTLIDHAGTPCTDIEYENEKWENRMYALSHSIVSTGYEYWEGIRDQGLEGKSKYIPLPIDCTGFEVAHASPTDKLRIFYGTNRAGFKGSKYILPALAKIAEKYCDQVELILPSRLPFQEYTRLLQTADVVLDQCNTYSYGMNSIIAGAMAKIVLTGAEPEALAAIGVLDACTFVNIKPDEHHIFAQVESIIRKSPEERLTLKQRTQHFVSNHHSHVAVAKQYKTLFHNLLGS